MPDTYFPINITRQKRARLSSPFILLLQTGGILAALVAGFPWSIVGMAVAGAAFIANFAVLMWRAIKEWSEDGWSDVSDDAKGRFYFGLALTVLSAAAAFAIAFGFFPGTLGLVAGTTAYMGIVAAVSVVAFVALLAAAYAARRYEGGVLAEDWVLEVQKLTEDFDPTAQEEVGDPQDLTATDSLRSSDELDASASSHLDQSAPSAQLGSSGVEKSTRSPTEIKSLPERQPKRDLSKPLEHKSKSTDKETIRLRIEQSSNLDQFLIVLIDEGHESCILGDGRLEINARFIKSMSDALRRELSSKAASFHLDPSLLETSGSLRLGAKTEAGKLELAQAYERVTEHLGPQLEPVPISSSASVTSTLATTPAMPPSSADVAAATGEVNQGSTQTKPEFKTLAELMSYMRENQGAKTQFFEEGDDFGVRVTLQAGKTFPGFLQNQFSRFGLIPPGSKPGKEETVWEAMSKAQGGATSDDLRTACGSELDQPKKEAKEEAEQRGLGGGPSG